MSTAALQPVRPPEREGTHRPTPTRVNVALLGLGRVGSAVARLASTVTLAGGGIHVTTALVRDVHRPRRADVAVTGDSAILLATRPQIVIEALGGIEPARTLVLDCLCRGIHVVTANKSLIAAHGDELREAAASAGVQLRYEATVMAGVPFLGTFARRPFASDASGVTGILNGTSHYILTSVQRGATFAGALADAQRLGLAEPDPSSDIDGVDAAEKLAILVRLLGGLRLRPSSIDRRAISEVTPRDLEQAAPLGGTIKPVARASWAGADVHAFVEPAFVPAAHPLASIAGLTNGVLVESTAGPLFYSGPGAGPDVTARTLLDDVAEVVAGDAAPGTVSVARDARAVEAPCPWLLRLASHRPLPDGADIGDLLASHGVFVQRASGSSTRDGGDTRWLLTYRAAATRVEAALGTIRAAAGCAATAFRGLEASDVR